MNMKSSKDTTIIFVNPVPRISAQGRHKQVFTMIGKTGELVPTTGMQKNKEFGVPSEYSFPYNPTTNRLHTGLDKMIINPFKGLDPSYIVEEYGLSQEWLSKLETIVKQDNIKLQTKYEIYDNVPYNHYTNEIAGGSTIFNTTNIKTANIAPPNFLQTFKILLYDKPNRFTDETPRGRLAIALIKIHPKIANGKNEANASVHEWYISEENEAQAEKLKKQDFIDDVKYAWVELKRNGSPFILYKFGSLLTTHDNRPIIKGTVNNDTVKNFISDYLNDTTSHQIDNLSKFIDLYTLYQEDGDLFNIRYLIQQAINTNVMKISDGYYVWHSKSGTPNMYKHTDYNKLVSLLQQEFKNYNPDDRTITNWYRDLFEEVQSKGAWLEQ